MEGSDGHEEGEPPKVVLLIGLVIGLTTMLLLCVTSHIG